MTWIIEYARSVRKDIRGMPASTRKRIRDFLEQHVANLNNPRAIGNPLKGELAGFWRYRVGNHRVICQIEDERVTVIVIRVGHRRDVYRR
ncbi:MAG TPA: type II toxin-antitoxin system RelE/ParE family toxin [Salinisphaeraceae bacterium]|nr:type II toxin-antitoxin system RelE/ParE family toxin [Salinisphaeraceae bacterium]